MQISNISINLGANVGSMARALQVQRLNASIIDKTLESVSKFGGSGSRASDMARLSGKGINLDIKV